MAVAGQQADAHRIAAGHQPVAIMLDLVNPVGPNGGLSAGDSRQGSIKPAGADRVRALNEDMAER